MIFVIIGYDGPDGQAKRKQYRQAHLERMDPLNKAGKVVLAGPLTDGAGSLIVINAASLEEAKAFAAAIPTSPRASSPVTKSIPSCRSTRRLRAGPVAESP